MGPSPIAGKAAGGELAAGLAVPAPQLGQIQCKRGRRRLAHLSLREKRRVELGKVIKSMGQSAEQFSSFYLLLTC